MDTTSGLIEAVRHGDTLVLTPRRDLRELSFEEVEVGLEEVLRRVEADASLRGLVVDLGRTDYFGSTALALLVRLRHELRERGGRMALCNVSAHEADILAVSGLDGLWTAYPSRAAALAAVASGGTAA
jgi:anti-anti-sigma factor